MPNNADLRTVLAYEAIRNEFEAEIAALKKEIAELKQMCKTTEDTALAVLAAGSCEEHSRVSFQEFSRAEIVAGCAQCARRDNAELRRWLGAAAKEVRGFSRGYMGYEAASVAVFESLSRGEQVSDEVRRMYLGDEEP